MKIWNAFSTFFTFLNPISEAYSLKHRRHMLSPYFLINPWWFEQTRLKYMIILSTVLSTTSANDAYALVRKKWLPIWFKTNQMWQENTWTDHEREPGPYLRGCENHKFWWPILTSTSLLYLNFWCQKQNLKLWEKFSRWMWRWSKYESSVIYLGGPNRKSMRKI